MLAFALRSEGWYLRQNIIWAKPNPLPESVTDRCTKSHEYVFLFTRSANYYFNHAAMLEPAVYDGRSKTTRSISAKYLNNAAGIATQGMSKNGGERWANKIRTTDTTIPARNKRSVWTVPTHAFKGAHFATYPPDLIRTCIKAGSRPGGIVLDPFIGAGTTALVAQELGRNYVGIELNSEYVKIAQERLKNDKI